MAQENNGQDQANEIYALMNILNNDEVLELQYAEIPNLEFVLPDLNNILALNINNIPALDLQIRRINIPFQDEFIDPIHHLAPPLLIRPLGLNEMIDIADGFDEM